MRRWFSLLCLCLLFWAGGKTALGSVRINEIYPAATTGENEWIEVYNDSSEEMDLTLLFLSDSDGKLLKWSDTLLEPFAFSIATSINVLNNSGDTVNLKQGENLLDSKSYTTIDSTKSWQRCKDKPADWTVSTLISKQAENTVLCETPTPTQISIPSATPIPIPTPQNSITVYLSEIMPYPDNEKEWVEIYNPNDFEVALNNWQIDDILDGGSSPKLFSLTLFAKSYATVELPTSVFNNEGDGVRLLNEAGLEIETLEYHEAEKGQSYARQEFIGAPEWCFTSPSRNNPNSECLETELELGASSTPSPLPTLSVLPTISIISKLQKGESDNIKLGDVFYTLSKPKVLGTKTQSKNLDRNALLKKRFELSIIWTSINLGLNLLSLVYILGYYGYPEEKPFFPL